MTTKNTNTNTNIITKLKTENINIWLSQIQNEYKLAMSVDCVIFGYTDADLYVALRECNMPPYEGDFSLVGDLLKNDEDLDDAAYRIVSERTSLQNIYLEQVQCFSTLKRHPLGRVITVAYYSLVKIDDYHALEVKDHSLIWRNVNDVDQLAFDHKLIFETCLTKLKKQMKEHPIGFNLLPKKFTINQLQQLYEVVLSVAFDKRNFRRKLKALDVIKDLNEIEKDVSHRPAKLYAFDLEKYEAMNKIEFSI